MHLQSARALSERADTRVNEMLAVRGNLPYAVGVEASDQLLLGQTVISDEVSINNWFNFISANFGNAGLLFMDDSVKHLYAFKCGEKSLTSHSALAVNQSNLVSVSGRIIQVLGADSIVMEREGGETMTVHIVQGVALYANQPGYEWRVGDGLLVKGELTSEGQITAVSLVCLH